MVQFKHKDLIGMGQLSVDDIELVLNTAVSMREISNRKIKKVPTLRGKCIVLYFQEPSTRTRTSFEIAAKRLSADTINAAITESSFLKRESFYDTIQNIEAMKPDAIIMRHPCSGASHMVAKAIKACVINAGDGMNEHPTQALLDIFTIREKKGKISGLNIVIIGDIYHSRVARSNIIGLKKLGAEITVSGPPTLIPKEIKKLGVNIVHEPAIAIKDKDVIIVLRIQSERQGGYLFPSIREYAEFFGINRNVLKNAKEDVIVMHPGPINRGVEMSSDVADGPNSVILEQVANGVAIRMALLYLFVGGTKGDDMD